MRTTNEPVTQVLYGMCADDGAESAGTLTTWGRVHYGLGRVSREELESNYPELLDAAGIAAADVPDGLFWIITEYADGQLSASSFTSHPAYRSAFNACEIDWAEFALAS